MTIRLSRRAALSAAALVSPLAAPRLARAQAPRVRFTLDWIFSGVYAFAAVAERRGYFKDAGVDVTVTRGFGSGRVPVDLAAGTFDMGFGDFTPALRFMSQNPASGIVFVGPLFDQAPTSATVRADGPITHPKMLAGKTLAAPDFDGGRQVFPVFARTIGIDPASITWLSVSPELREPMLVQKRADGITGFVTSTALSLKALGMDLPQQRIFRYREFGMDYFYGNTLMTTRAFAEKNPEAVRGTVAAMMRALRWTYANQAAAIAELKAREPLTDVAIEAERQTMAMNELVMSDNVKRLGLGVIEPPRLARQIEAVKDAFALPTMPSLDQTYTDAFLPPAADRVMG